VFDANFGVYGVRKLWRRLLLEGLVIGRSRRDPTIGIILDDFSVIRH